MALTKIYAIDDDMLDRKMLQRVVERSGKVNSLELYSYAESAIEALERCDRLPELILLDINMPRMNGFEFLEIVDEKLSQAQPPVKVALLTTSSNPADARKAESFASVGWFLSKPLGRDMLDQLVSEFS